MAKKSYYKKKYKKTLKKSNIFGNKSAKGQAKQIYALSKKIRRIQKETSPELQILQNNILHWEFKTGDQPYNSYANSLVIYRDQLLNSTRDHYIEMKGSILRPRFLNLYGLFGIYNDTTICGDWNISSGKTLEERQPMTAYMRIVVCRIKKGGDKLPLRVTQDTETDYTSQPMFTDVKPICGPLIHDLTSQLTVLKDKVIKVNTNNPMKMWKIRLSARKLGYIYRKAAHSQAVGENEIAIYYHYICPNMLRYYDTTTQSSYVIGPHARFTMNYNFGYVDES